jgi:hypothetical protein
MVEKRVSTGSHPQSEIQGRKEQSADCLGIGYIPEYGTQDRDPSASDCTGIQEK